MTNSGNGEFKIRSLPTLMQLMKRIMESPDTTEDEKEGKNVFLSTQEVEALQKVSSDVSDEIQSAFNYAAQAELSPLDRFVSSAIGGIMQLGDDRMGPEEIANMAFQVGMECMKVRHRITSEKIKTTDQENMGPNSEMPKVQ